LANSPQAIKRARQNKKRALHNTSQRSTMRTAIKKILKMLESGDKSAASTAFPNTASFIDKVAGRKLIHRNRAARLKSRLQKRINQAQ